LRNEMETDAFN